MAETKRYFWLQLKKDFFKTRAMKKLRSIAGGDTYTIIYLKMQLLSLENGGILYHEGVEDDMIEEIALDIDESPTNVRIAFEFLIKCNLIEVKEDQMYLPEVNENMGSETASAQRVRRFRAKKQPLMLQSNGNYEQCNKDVTSSNAGVISSNVELEKELEKELYKKSYNKKEKTDAEIANEILNEKDREVLPASNHDRIKLLKTYWKSKENLPQSKLLDVNLSISHGILGVLKVFTNEDIYQAMDNFNTCYKKIEPKFRIKSFTNFMEPEKIEIWFPLEVVEEYFPKQKKIEPMSKMLEEIWD